MGVQALPPHGGMGSVEVRVVMADAKTSTNLQIKRLQRRQPRANSV